MIVGISGGLKAKEDLDIGKKEFNWKSVALVLLIVLPLNFATQYLIFQEGKKTPSCAAVETKELVIQIAKEQLTKNGLGEILSTVTMQVEDIRTLNHNENVDSYECAATFRMIGRETEPFPITYTIQSVEDKEGFYVEVLGFN